MKTKNLGVVLGETGLDMNIRSLRTKDDFQSVLTYLPKIICCSL